MRTMLKKTLLVGLPLAGLLTITPVASAHDRGEHAEIHRDLGDVHDDFHQMPHSRREHRRFHKELKREHRALDRGLRGGWGGYDDNRYGYGRYGYGQPYYDDDYYGSSPSDQYGYGRRPSYDDPYR